MEQIIITIWGQLLWPLIRILLLVSLGLLVANFIEALNWTQRLAVLARPLIRFGRLSSITGASFIMAFFSGVSANSMLSEAFDQEKINKRELVLANPLLDFDKLLVIRRRGNLGLVELVELTLQRVGALVVVAELV